MYLKYFTMTKKPFGHTPDTELYYPTTTHIEAMNVLLYSISSGEAFCKITGEVGCGKTMLCRLLIRHLEKTRNIAYIPNPNLSVRSLHFALAKELGLELDDDCREDQVTHYIQCRLIQLNRTKGAVVLIVDEAQVMSDEALEALRLFTNVETEEMKLLQIILFAQPELDARLKQTNLRQLKQRISFSYRLSKLNTLQVKHYIKHRLEQVCIGKNIKTSILGGVLISYFSKGTPRLINTICHKALLLAYAKKQQKITLTNIIKASRDTEGVERILLKNLRLISVLLLLSISSTALAFLGTT